MQPSHDIFCSKYTKSKKFSKIIVACQMTFIYLYLFSWSYRCTISKLESLLWLQQNPLTCLLDSVSKLMGIFVLPSQIWHPMKIVEQIDWDKSIRSILNHTAPCASMLRGQFRFSDDVYVIQLQKCWHYINRKDYPFIPCTSASSGVTTRNSIIFFTRD